jgi:hypothetical protein
VPSVSKASVPVTDHGGPGREWAQDLGGYTASLVETEADADLTPLLQGLPDDQCPCPHWGFVFKGSMWWRYGDREEVIHAGEAFFVPPGHTSGASAGSEFVIFSPTEQIREVEEHMGRRAQELMGSSR